MYILRPEPLLRAPPSYIQLPDISPCIFHISYIQHVENTLFDSVPTHTALVLPLHPEICCSLSLPYLSK